MYRASAWKSLIVVCFGLTCASCLNFPRNNQVVTSKATAVSFEGFYWDLPNAEIRVFVKNRFNSAYEQIVVPTITTGTTPYVDNAGDTWYKFQANIVIPGLDKYWAAGVGRTLMASVKAVGPGNQQLVSFDTGSNTDTCINTQLQTGGGAVMTNCDSSESPNVKLLVSCGTANADCCVSGNACDMGKNCAAQLCTASCGAVGQSCCNAAPGCSGTNVCIGTMCNACKAKGTACAANAECCGGLTCNGGVCKTPCNAGASCTVPGLKGSCAAGSTLCGGLDPVCQQVVFAQPDNNCNNVDEDCNGTADNGYVSHSCSTHPGVCQGGFTATGTSSCSNGSENCSAQEGVGYCTICGGACGACGATPCTPGSTKCSPGFVCKAGATLGCGVQDSSTSCWPIDSGHCNGCNAACWKPSDVTLGGACP
jgi:hypothetical protein